MGFHVYEIVKYELNVRLESDLKQKKLNEEQLADVYGRLNEEKQKQNKSLMITLIIAAVIGLFGAFSYILAGAGIGYLLLFVILFVGAVGGGLYTGWYYKVGKISKQWNALIKEHYPDVYDKYKL